MTIFLVTSPSSWPAYSNANLILYNGIGIPAFIVFRDYQQAIPDQHKTILHYLLIVLAYWVQLSEHYLSTQVLLKNLVPKLSFAWFRDYGFVLCHLVLQRYVLVYPVLTTLIMLASLRLILMFYPYEFQALNHKIVFAVSLAILLLLPLMEMMVRVIICGHGCWEYYNELIFNWYGERINLDMSCNNNAITPIAIMPLLVIVIYLANFLIEWKRRRSNRIRPQDQNPPQPDRVKVSTISAHVPRGVRVMVPCIQPNQDNGPIVPPAIKEASKVVLKTGGVTLLLIAVISFPMMYRVVSGNEILDAETYVKIGVACFNHLVWFWISYEVEIRSATDRRMKGAAQWLLTRSFWPERIKAYANSW